MPKKCRICKKPFQPFNSLQVACSTACAIKVAIDQYQGVKVFGV